MIHVGAAADELHQQLVDALAPGGRMVIPLGPRYGSQVGCNQYCAVLRKALLASRSSSLNRRLGPAYRVPLCLLAFNKRTPPLQRQVLTVVDKAPDGSVTRQELMHVGYVPLTRPSEMEDGYLRYS